MDLDKKSLFRHANNAAREAQSTMKDLHVDNDIDDKLLPVKAMAAVKRAEVLTPKILSQMDLGYKGLLSDAIIAVKCVEKAASKNQAASQD